MNYEGNIKYTWEQFDQNIEALARQIERSGKQYDLILGFVRGGLVPAVALSHRLGIPMATIHWSVRDHQRKELSYEWISTVFDGEGRCLFVEDIVDGGSTIREVFLEHEQAIRDEVFDVPPEYLSEYISAVYDQTDIATIFYNPSADTNGTLVDYFAVSLDRNKDKRFVDFPWEK